MSTHAHATAARPAASTALLQRKCACGARAGSSGHCPACERKKTLGLQPKLAISTPGDRWEREADLAADKVLAGRGFPSLSRLSSPPLQREGDDEKKKAPPSPVTEGLGLVASNLGDNNPAFSKFTERLGDRFMAQPAPLSIGVPVFLGANYAFLWTMALADPAMRRQFDDFNLAMLPGIVPQFPVKTFKYQILDAKQSRFGFDIGLDASKLMEAFNQGVLNTRISSLKLDTSGKLDTAGPRPLSLSALQVQLGLFGDGLQLSGGFRNGISPYPLLQPGGPGGDTSRIMAQSPALPDLYANQRDVRFTVMLDLPKLIEYLHPSTPSGPEALQRAALNGDAAMAPTAGDTVQATLAGTGAPLDSATRGFMEGRFGHDFGRVRIHADGAAAASAQAVQARAYTVGSDIVFGASQYAPASTAGRHLLAHELAHVVQQDPLASPVVQRDTKPDSKAASPNALDKTAQDIIAAAKDTQATPDKGQRATDAVRAILKAYYAGEAAKVSDVVYDAKDPGLTTSPVGTGANVTGKITVGDYFVDHIDSFARRVLQVGHELQHVDQQRGGMGGPAKQNEREFLAFAWEALQDPKAGTGSLGYAMRRDMIDCALGHLLCLDAADQKNYEPKKKQLLDKRDTVNGKGGHPATDAPTGCKQCSKGAGAKVDKSAAPAAPATVSVQPAPTKVSANEADEKKSTELSIAAGGEAEVSGEGAEGKATLSFEASFPVSDLLRPGGLRLAKLGGAPLKLFDEFSLSPSIALAGGPQGRVVSPLALEASLKMISVEWEKQTRVGTFTLGLGVEGSATGEYTPQTRAGKVDLGVGAGAELEYEPGKNKNFFIKIEAKGEGKFSKDGSAQFEWSGVSFTAGASVGFKFGK